MPGRSTNPTDQVKNAAKKQAVQQGVQFQQEAPINSMGELYQNLFFGDRSPYLEIDKHLSSGYLKEQEIRWSHHLGDVIRNLALLQNQYGLTMHNTGHFFQRKLNFITMVSKSRAGFAIKEAGTSRVHSDERYMLDEDEDDGAGLLDKFGKWLTGGSGGGGMLGGSHEQVLPRQQRMWDGGRAGGGGQFQRYTGNSRRRRRSW